MLAVQACLLHLSHSQVVTGSFEAWLDVEAGRISHALLLIHDFVYVLYRSLIAVLTMSYHAVPGSLFPAIATLPHIDGHYRPRRSLLLQGSEIVITTAASVPSS